MFLQLKSFLLQKFVSTTIRPSTLPYPELYTWQGCGKFVSDYVEYEPLDKALSMVSNQMYFPETPYFMKFSDKGP